MVQRAFYAARIATILDESSERLQIVLLTCHPERYYDHQSEFDAEIRRQLKELDALRDDSLDSPIRQRLRSAGKLP